MIITPEHLLAYVTPGPRQIHRRGWSPPRNAAPRGIPAGHLLSSVDVSLPVARLILGSLIPDARQVHLAEVFASGLLQPASAGSYDFVPGVREVLQESLTTTATIYVWRTITPYLEAATGQRAPFSLLLDPDASESADVTATALGRIAADIIDRLGLVEPVPVMGPTDTAERHPESPPLLLHAPLRCGSTTAALCARWRSAPTAAAGDRRRRRHGAAVGPHQRERAGGADQPQRRRARAGVQPRPAAAGDRRRRRHGAAVGPEPPAPQRPSSPATLAQ